MDFNKEDVIGVKFNMLEVVSFSHIKINKSGYNIYYYNCKCDCGSNCIANRQQINQKRKISCGCEKSKKTKEFNKLKKKYNKYNLDGEFGIGYTFKNEEFYFDLEDYEKIKDYCWRIGNKGYIMCTINGNKRYDLLFHRLVFDLDFTDKVDVDHINGTKTRNDNRKHNLRVCSHAENMRNRLTPDNNTSGIIGVSFDKTHNVWKSFITHNDKRNNIGSYKNKEDAIKNRLEKEKALFGEFAPQKNLFEQYNI